MSHLVRLVDGKSSIACPIWDCEIAMCHASVLMVDGEKSFFFINIKHPTSTVCPHETLDSDTT